MLFAAVSLAGCGETSPGDARSTAGEPSPVVSAESTGISTPSDASGGSAQPSPSGPAGEIDPPRDSGSAIAVEGEGLRLFDRATGAARPVPFGTSVDDVVTIVTGSEGMSPRDRGETPDCGLAYATWDSGLTLTARSGRFTGWSIRPAPGDSALTTASGVGIGSSRREVEGVYRIEVVDSSLGIEFSAGGLAGVFDSAGPDGKVAALWAGEVCIAR